jgi:hypothetical protein
MVGGKIVPADKTFRIEKLLYPRIAPVNGNSVHVEGIDQFFGAPTGPASVFKSDVEAVAGEPIHLDLITVARRKAVSCVVQGSAG